MDLREFRLEADPPGCRCYHHLARPSLKASLFLSLLPREGGGVQKTRNALHVGIYARKRSPARLSHLTGGKHSCLSSGSAAMTARLLLVADDDLMARTALWGRSDCLAAMLDGNQEAPPSDTNAGSAHRITPHSPSCGTSVSVPGGDALLSVTQPVRPHHPPVSLFGEDIQSCSVSRRLFPCVTVFALRFQRCCAERLQLLSSVRVHFSTGHAVSSLRPEVLWFGCC